jgi:hypothetical protein
LNILTDSNFVTQDQRISDLEDVAYLKKRVVELEEKITRLEPLIRGLSQKQRKHRGQVTAFLGYVPVEKKQVKNTDDFLEALGE